MNLPSPVPLVTNIEEARQAIEILWRERSAAWGLAAIESAATIAIPDNATVGYITGTTNITSITASGQGRIIALYFNDVLTVTDGSNLALAGNFVTSNSDTLTLLSDGVNWYEMARSIN